MGEDGVFTKFGHDDEMSETQRRMAAGEEVIVNTPVATIFANTESLTEAEWLELRRKGIGGSDVGSICGVNKYRSAYELYLDKLDRLPVIQTENEAMHFGKVLEPVIADEFERRNPEYEVIQVKKMFQNVQYPFMLANVDRFISLKQDSNIPGLGVLEIKTSSEYMLDEWESGNVPESYILQCQHYMAVMGLQFTMLAVLIGGNKYRQFRIERDQGLIDNLIKLEAEFWDKVQNQIEPAIDIANPEILKALYPEAVENKTVQLPDDLYEDIISYENHKYMEKVHKEEMDKYANKLKSLIGDAEYGFCKDVTISYKNIFRKAYTVAESSYRDFRVKLPEGKKVK